MVRNGKSRLGLADTMALKTLQEMWQKWREGEQSGEVAHRLLEVIGYLCRSGPEGELEKALRSVQVGLVSDLPHIMEEYTQYVHTVALGELSKSLEKALQRVSKGGQENAILSLCQKRDAIACALWAAWDFMEAYLENEGAYQQQLAKIRTQLDEIDVQIVLRKELLLAMQEFGKNLTAPLPDQEWFWWLPSQYEGCFLPMELSVLLFTKYEHHTLEEELVPLYESHLLECDDCYTLWQELVRERMRHLFTQSPPLAAAAERSALPPQLHIFNFTDESQNWQGRIVLSEGGAPQKEVWFEVLVEEEGWEIRLGDVAFPVDSKKQGTNLPIDALLKYLAGEAELLLISPSGECRQLHPHISGK